MKTLWASEREPELNAYLSQWASRHCDGHIRGFGACTTMGVFDGERLVGCMVFHNFFRESGVIEISGAALSPRWLTRPVLWEMFDYPFNRLGCQTVAMRVGASNKRLHRTLTRYGFKCYILPRLRGRTEDEFVFLLTDDDWRNNGFHPEVIGNGKEKARLA